MPKDKQKHIFAGLALSLTMGLLCTPEWGLATAVVVGAAKEIIWDWWWRRGTPEWWDFWATCLGGTAGFTVLTILGAG